MNAPTGQDCSTRFSSSLHVQDVNLYEKISSFPTIGTHYDNYTGLLYVHGRILLDLSAISNSGALFLSGQLVLTHSMVSLVQHIPISYKLYICVHVYYTRCQLKDT